LLSAAGMPYYDFMLFKIYKTVANTFKNKEIIQKIHIPDFLIPSIAANS
jgi:hypothetical protein